MSVPVLEPLTAIVTWHYPQAVPIETWKELFAAQLEAIAAEAEEVTETVIGHIKALAILPDKGYVRGSSISFRHPADVEVVLKTKTIPSNLSITFNVLVYGWPYADARRACEKIFEKMAANSLARCKVEIPLKPPHAHDHHAQEHE
jgi:hypothetical protein